MKQVIVASSYIDSYPKLLVTELWAKVVRKLNPDIDIVLFDSASPISPADLCAGSNINLFTYNENLGHNSINGVDGWGRAFCDGLDYAVAHGYDYVHYTNSNFLCSRPVTPIFEKMKRTGVKVCCPLDITYTFIENGLMYFSVPYLVESKYTERYDWQNNNGIVPEVNCERLCDDELFLLPMRGLRNDKNQLHPGNVMHAFAYGMDFLSHCEDFRVVLLFLKRCGIEV